MDEAPHRQLPRPQVLAERLFETLQRFLHVEAVSGVVLLIAAIAAIASIAAMQLLRLYPFHRYYRCDRYHRTDVNSPKPFSHCLTIDLNSQLA